MTSHSVFPARLNLGDLLFDAHQGRDGWLPVVAISLEAEHVVVRLGDDPEPVRLPVGRLVKVRRATEEPGETPVVSKENAGTFYAGDIVAAQAAAAARQRAAAAPVPAGDGRPADPYKSAWYPGDLDSVMGAEAAEAGERRRAVMSEKSTSAARRKVSDQDEVMKESDEVEERMGGMYAGDLDFIIKQNK